MDGERWSHEQVLAVAPSPATVTAAETLTDASSWSNVGADRQAVWGRCRGSGREPYDIAIDHVELG